MTDDTRRTAERAARVSYGRLLALLSSWSRDIAGAEDALGDAFAAALSTWPERGVPESPDAWLLSVARNRLRNRHRHAAMRDAAQPEIERRLADRAFENGDVFPDQRLKLLFVCAHPAIDPAIRTPLMLQTVLGLDAVKIASAFLVAPTTMGQRLVRAKAKIRQSQVRFEIPAGEHFAERLDDVLEAVYAAYGSGWESVGGAAAGVTDLADEALFLGRLLVQLMPGHPEPQGLLALMLYCEARRMARRDGDGRFVPLAEQDTRLWSRDMIIEAEGLLASAARSAHFGRFQCQAAIQSLHVQRAITGQPRHEALRVLYDLLAAHAPTVGVLVGRAAAVLDAGDPHAAIAYLNALDRPATVRYQPFWVTRANALASLGRVGDALNDLETAVGLTEDAAVRAHLVSVRGRWKQQLDGDTRQT